MKRISEYFDIAPFDSLEKECDFYTHRYDRVYFDDLSFHIWFSLGLGYPSFYYLLSVNSYNCNHLTDSSGMNINKNLWQN